jgi:2',3'-cyclic-nucleotide 2'-phosphodiesterase (5'-nucleotidase family)
LPETKKLFDGSAFNRQKLLRNGARNRAENARGGRNAIVGLTHLFMFQDKNWRNARIRFNSGGHEHTLLQSSANGTPIFKMTADARELGRFNLNFDAKTKRLESIDWEIIPVSDKIESAPEFASVFDKIQRPFAKTRRAGRNELRFWTRFLCQPHKGNERRKLHRRQLPKRRESDVALVNGGSIVLI